MKLFAFLLLFPCLLGVVSVAADDAAGLRFYTGTYTGATSKGIYLCRLNLQSGEVTVEGLAAEAANPTFLALHPNHQFLYAVNEISDFEGKKAGGVGAFAIDAASGRLTLLNQQSSGGKGPCHVAVDKKGTTLVVANYGSGSVSSLPIGGDGRLGAAASFFQHEGAGENKNRQDGPHAHCVTFDREYRFGFICDLGLDQILIYRLDPTKSTLTPSDPPFVAVKAGAGPRHFVFHPAGKHAYVINELDSTIIGFDWEADRGKLVEIQTVRTLPEDFTGSNTTAEIEVHPSGKFVYGSNRGHDSIASFSIDEATGKLTPIEHVSTGGKTPRNFAIDPTGAFLLAANQDTHNIVTFRIDQTSGRLTKVGEASGMEKPVCITFMPSR